MSRFGHNRRMMIALAVVIAVVAIVVPTCRMVGCSMPMSAPMMGHLPMTILFGDCGGELVYNGAPTAVVPSGLDSLTVALLAAVMAAVALALPRTTPRAVFVSETGSPPPPVEPGGMRLRL